MAKVSVIMGSRSDLATMQNAVDMLKEFQISYEVKVISAHRMRWLSMQKKQRETAFR